MQQMISFVPTVPTQATQLPTGGPGQAGSAGVFQGMLLEALLGVQAATAGQPGATGQVPGEPLPTAQAQTQTGQSAPDAQPGEAPPMPIRLSGPVPPATAPVPQSAAPVTPQTDPAELPAPAPEGDGGGSEQPVEGVPNATSTLDPALMARVQGAQAVPPPPPATPAQVQEGMPSTAPPLPAASGSEPSNPQLEAFVEKVVRAVQGEESTTSDNATETSPKPTFQDLVKLAVQAERSQTGGQGSQQGAAQGDAKPQAAIANVAEPEQKGTEAVSAPVTRDPAPVAREQANAAQAPDPAPRQPVEPEPVLRQVTRFIKVMVDAKQSEVRLNLHPEHLGQIAVKLIVGDGAIRANLVAQDMAVKAALEANLDQLKTRLADQGFQVEQVHVSVGTDSGHSQHSRQGEQRQPHQQPWRHQQSNARSQEEPAAQQQRSASAPWSQRGTGVRLNSLA